MTTKIDRYYTSALAMQAAYAFFDQDELEGVNAINGYSAGRV